MRRKETRILFENWNKFLLRESTANKVRAMIDKLAEKKSKIIIKEEGEHTIFIIYKSDDKSDDKNKLRGSIRCHSSWWELNGQEKPLGIQNSLGIGLGEVNSTWYISLTSKTTHKMGPLLYEVLMEYISHKEIKNAALKPDYSYVSDAAVSVWDKFNNRSDIKKIQLDADSDTVNLYKRRGKNVKQITPAPPADNIRDDTKQNSAINHKGHDNWKDSSLSKAYRKDNHNLITSLVSRELIEMPDYASKLFDEDRFGEIEDGDVWGEF